MHERSQPQTVGDDEQLFDRDEIVAAGEREVEDPLPRERLVPPLPPPKAPRNAPDLRFDTGTYSSAPTRTSSFRELNPFRPGDVLAGRYLVERIAGGAGLGILAHVRHVDLGQRLLLKCLPLEACQHPDSVERFLRGARAAMRLQGEHIARTIDAGRLSSGAPYVVSEALTGCDLHEVLRVRGAVTPSEAIDIVLQAAEALAEAHSYGLVHRNINPFTLFSTRRPDGSLLVKVLDFGVAETLRVDPLRSHAIALDAYTVSGGSNPVAQALAYCSPEQLRNPNELDPRTDIWALGAVLHELLAGQPAYQADSIPGLWASIAADPPLPITSFRSDLSAGVESVILRCLSKDRSTRFASVAELSVALKPFASPESALAVDRITRTLGRTQGALAAHASALVHVGPVATAAAAALAPPARAPSFPLLWSTLLVAFGLVGGTLAGVLVATRGVPVDRSSSNAQAGLEQRVLAALPLTTDSPIAPATGFDPAPSAAAKPTLAVATPPGAAPLAIAPALRVISPTPATVQRLRSPARIAKPAVAPAPAPEIPSKTEPSVAAPEAEAKQDPARLPSTATETPPSDAPRAKVATGSELFDSMR